MNQQSDLMKQVERDRAWRALQEAKALRDAFPYDPVYSQKLMDAQTRYYNT